MGSFVNLALLHVALCPLAAWGVRLSSLKPTSNDLNYDLEDDELSTSPLGNGFDRLQLANTRQPNPDLPLKLKFMEQVDVELFRQRAVNNLVITTLSNFGYFPVLKHWLDQIDALRIPGVTAKDNVTVICVDTELQEALRSIGHPCQLLVPSNVSSNTSAFSGISFYRHFVASVLNKHGLDVLYTDADAMWLQNPLPELFSTIKEAGRPGIIASRGHYPFDLHNQWGATLCTGVLLYHGRLPDVFWDSLDTTREKVNDGHDQNYINILLATVGVTWRGEKVKYMESGKVDYGFINVFDLSVALLPHSGYPRLCYNLVQAEVKILHCLRDKVAGRKVLEWDDAFTRNYTKGDLPF